MDISGVEIKDENVIEISLVGITENNIKNISLNGQNRDNVLLNRGFSYDIVIKALEKVKFDELFAMLKDKSSRYETITIDITGIFMAEMPGIKPTDKIEIDFEFDFTRLKIINAGNSFDITIPVTEIQYNN